MHAAVPNSRRHVGSRYDVVCRAAARRGCARDAELRRKQLSKQSRLPGMRTYKRRQRDASRLRKAARWQSSCKIRTSDMTDAAERNDEID